MVSKKFCLALLFGMFLVIGSYNILAATTLNSPTTGTNHSGTLSFNCTTALLANHNASLFYNSSGGVTGTFLSAVTNTSASQTEFYNGTVDISSLSATTTYNMSCYADNGTTQEWSVGATSIIIDNVAPNVSSIGSPVSGSGYSDSVEGLLLLNATINDNLNDFYNVTSVYFNVTTSAGVQNATVSASQIGSSWNATLDLTGFPDGEYNVIVYAIDSAGNINSSESVSVSFDNTNPVVSLTRSSYGSTSLTLAISIDDSTSTTCTSSRTGATISGTTLTENSLSCGNSYDYIVTCTDLAGNSGASSSTSFSTTGCSSGSTSTTTFSWKNTYVVNSEDFEAGYTKTLSLKERVKVRINNLNHYVGVKELDLTSATIEIASDPVTVKLDVGGETKVDVDSDGFWDIFVKLNSLVDEKADITVQSINEEIPEGESSTEVDGGKEITNGEVEEGKSKTWLWILITLVILIVIGSGIGMSKKKR